MNSLALNPHTNDAWLLQKGMGRTPLALNDVYHQRSVTSPALVGCKAKQRGGKRKKKMFSKLIHKAGKVTTTYILQTLSERRAAAHVLHFNPMIKMSSFPKSWFSVEFSRDRHTQSNKHGKQKIFIKSIWMAWSVFTPFLHTWLIRWKQPLFMCEAESAHFNAFFLKTHAVTVSINWLVKVALCGWQYSRFFSMKVRRSLNFCYIKAFAWAADSI